MPEIKLKPNSPEYADPDVKSEIQICDMPGCHCDGIHKAPKHRGLNEYYYFCTEHIREYNNAWDYFEGMAEHEVQDHLNKSVYGFRPTWRYDNFQNMEDNLRAKTSDFAGSEQAEFGSGNFHENASDPLAQNTKAVEAMAIMGLEPPMDLSTIKETYKKLAKKHHPDLNRDDAQAEEKLKKINIAYTILKLAYADFEKLSPRD